MDEPTIPRHGGSGTGKLATSRPRATFAARRPSGRRYDATRPLSGSGRASHLSPVTPGPKRPERPERTTSVPDDSAATSPLSIALARPRRVRARTDADRLKTRDATRRSRAAHPTTTICTLCGESKPRIAGRKLCVSCRAQCREPGCSLPRKSRGHYYCPQHKTSEARDARARIHRRLALPDGLLNRTLQRHHLSREKYDAIYAQQGGQCAICNATEPGGNRMTSLLFIDHDRSCCPGNRSCGACVRGLLCQKCNLGLGHFQDSTALLDRAITYLSPR